MELKLLKHKVWGEKKNKEHLLLNVEANLLPLNNSCGRKFNGAWINEES
jgi:hypothetical protein